MRGSVPTRSGRRPDGGGPILISDAASMTTTMNAPFGAAWRNAARRAAPLLCAALLWAPQDAAAQDRGSVNPEPLPPLAHPDDPATPAKELFGRKTAPAKMERAHHRVLRQGLSRRRHGAADQRRDLAGDAPFAQSQLGPSEPGAIPGTAVRQGAADRLARSPGRRHVATARRPDAYRPCQPSGRSRRRHLAHAHARPRADARGARRNVGDHGRRRRPHRRRSEGLDAGASQA